MVPASEVRRLKVTDPSAALKELGAKLGVKGSIRRDGAGKSFELAPAESKHRLPREGQWHVRFNSGANVYDPGFINGDSFDRTANSGGKDGLSFNANVGVGPYSVVILSQ